MNASWRRGMFVLALCAGAAAMQGCGVRSGANIYGRNVTLNGVGPVIEGSGVAASEVREVGAFHAVELQHAFDVTIEVGGEPGIEITGDDNLLSLVVVEVRAGKLVLRVDGSYETDLGLGARITTPSLDELRVGGACHADVRGVEAKSFRLDVSGAGAAVVAGRIVTLRLDVSGSGHADVLRIDGGAVAADLSGASVATIGGEIVGLTLEGSGASAFVLSGLAGGSVSVDVSGASKARLSGTADTVEVEASGSASAQLGALEASDVAVDLSGAAHADVSATGSLQGAASGSSIVTFGGGPGTVEVETSGTATFRSK